MSWHSMAVGCVAGFAFLAAFHPLFLIPMAAAAGWSGWFAK